MSRWIPALVLWAVAWAWAVLGPGDAAMLHEVGGTPELLLLGMVLALALYNLLVALATRQALFAVYAGYGVASLVMWSTYFDVTSAWLSSWSARVSVNHVGTALLAAAVLAFLRRFLDLDVRRPRAAAPVASLAAGAAVAAPLLAFAPDALAERALAVYLAVVAVTGLVVVAREAAARRVAGVLLLVAFAPFAFAGLLFALGPLGVVSASPVGGRVLFALHVLEMLLLALALAGHIAQLRSERDVARQLALDDRRLREAEAARAGRLEAQVAAAVARATVEGLRARTDPLTGLGNRAAFERVIADLASCPGADALIAVADVDGLKRINDAHGHARGDALLVAFAGALRASLRAGDRCFRLGGDEFTIVAPGAGAGDVAAFEERLRGSLGRLARDFPGSGASLGVASLGETGGDAAAAVELADRRMYEEKRGALRARQLPSRPPPGLH